MQSANKEYENWITETDPWIPETYRITEKTIENKETVTFLIEPDGDFKPEKMSPGQFNMLFAHGKGEIAISVSSLETEGYALYHTIAGVGAASQGICALNVGDQLGVRGPFGNAWPVKEMFGKDVVIMAGGLGIAPLRPAIEYAINHRDEIGSINILYGARSPQNLVFHKDMVIWQTDPDLNFHITVDHSPKNWRGHVGTVTSLMEFARFDPKNTVGFVCGPEIMMRYSASKLNEYGISESNIYLSMERNMKCAIGLCGHCQWGNSFVCKDGPVYAYEDVREMLNIREL